MKNIFLVPILLLALTTIACIKKKPEGKAPAAPSNLKAVAINGNNVTITWNDNSDNELGFTLEEKDNVYNPVYKEWITVYKDITVYYQSNLTPGKTYTFRIKSYNTYGDSAFSNEVSVTP